MAKPPLFPDPVAHRGLHDRAAGIIENSASAFEAAIAGGFAIECDVQLSSDGIPIVFHDDDLDRLTAAKGPVGARKAAELTSLVLTGSSSGDGPPLFTDFLAQVRGRALLQIELKRQPNAEMTEAIVARVLEALANYTGPVTIESFDPSILIALRRHQVKMPIGIITYGYDEPSWDSDVPAARKFAGRHLLHWPLTRFDFISCRDNALDLPAVRLFRGFGVPVTTWTIKSAAAARAVAAKADQIVFEGFDPKSA